MVFQCSQGRTIHRLGISTHWKVFNKLSSELELQIPRISPGREMLIYFFTLKKKWHFPFWRGFPHPSKSGRWVSGSPGMVRVLQEPLSLFLTPALWLGSGWGLQSRNGHGGAGRSRSARVIEGSSTWFPNTSVLLCICKKCFTGTSPMSCIASCRNVASR